MQFVLNVIDDRTGSATPDEMTAIDAFNDRLRDEDRWVLAVGLAAPAESFVVDGRGETPLSTAGPFVESTEYVAGLWVLRAADAEEARGLAAAASRACGRRVEVRACLGG